PRRTSPGRRLAGGDAAARGDYRGPGDGRASGGTRRAVVRRRGVGLRGALTRRSGPCTTKTTKARRLAVAAAGRLDFRINLYDASCDAQRRCDVPAGT